jgi:hypothetical protein
MTSLTRAELMASRENKIRIVLSRGGVIEGRVTLDGRGVANQYVQLHYTSPSGMDKHTNTDEDGYYHIGTLPDGTATVQCQVNMVGSGQHKQVTATVAAEKVTVVDFDFSTTTRSSDVSPFGGR